MKKNKELNIIEEEMKRLGETDLLEYLKCYIREGIEVQNDMNEDDEDEPLIECSEEDIEIMARNLWDLLDVEDGWNDDDVICDCVSSVINDYFNEN